MGQVNTLISQRLKKQAASKKMHEMARKSSSGELTSFSGVFQISELSRMEKNRLKQILDDYQTEESHLKEDLLNLITITSEVKAINHQAALLHGERVKKAHAILTRYRNGAFTTWLIDTYGNRQTPYNLMQYYEFYQQVPTRLRDQLEEIPRQVIYTLATRQGALEDKLCILANYKGETKEEMLQLIREALPLPDSDKRKQNTGDITIQALKHIYLGLKKTNPKMTKNQKNVLSHLLENFLEFIYNSPTI